MVVRARVMTDDEIISNYDFERMMMTYPDGYEVPLEVMNGKLYAVRYADDGKGPRVVMNSIVQKAYQEYVSKLIEQELLKEDI